MDTPTYFYHAAFETIAALIKENNTLIPQVHNPAEGWMWLLNNHRELIPHGVWFCATLYNGGLPTFSPYGTSRVSIPIASVIQQLGGNVKLYAGVTYPHHTGNIYVRLMLVKANDEPAILQFMTKLDITNNPWLTLNVLTGQFRVASRPIWVEIYVPYPIDVSNCPWDIVQKI